MKLLSLIFRKYTPLSLSNQLFLDLFTKIQIALKKSFVKAS